MLRLNNVEETMNGSAALNNLQHRKADLVLLDWNMPQMSGIEFLQSIRKDENLKDIAVIMVTGMAEKKDIEEALQAGANDYIIKPFSPATFEKKIHKVFGS